MGVQSAPVQVWGGRPADPGAWELCSALLGFFTRDLPKQILGGTLWPGASVLLHRAELLGAHGCNRMPGISMGETQLCPAVACAVCKV